jgi:hypothetical protein
MNMKIKIRWCALVVLVGRVVLAHNCMDIFVINGGTETFPSAALVPGGVLPFTADFSFGSVTVGAQGLAPGAQVSGYNCFGDTTTDGATPTNWDLPSNEYEVIADTMGSDVNGSPAIFLTITYTCTTSYTVTGSNPLTVQAYPTVTFSDGTVLNVASGDYDPIIDGSAGFAPGAGFTDSTTGVTKCGLTWAVTWTPVSSGGATNSTPSNPNPGNGYTNTVVTLPSVDGPTNQIVWAPPSTNLFAENTGQQLGQTLYGAIGQGTAQEKSDAGAIVGAIDDFAKAQHSDMSVLTGAVGTNGAGIVGAVGLGLGGVTNAVIAVGNTQSAMLVTNFQMLASVVNSNGTAGLASSLTNLFGGLSNGFAGLGGNMTNLASGIVDLASSISNAMDMTNLDIMSETTGSNIAAAGWAVSSNLWAVSSNIVSAVTNRGRSITNYAEETTQQGISNLLAAIETNLSGGGIDTNYWMGRIYAGTNVGASVSGAAVAARIGGDMTVPSDSGGSTVPYEMTFTPLGEVTATVGAGVPSAYAFGRHILVWFLYLGLFVSCWKMFDSSVMASLGVPQGTTAGTSVLGTDVNVASALAMAGAIVAAVAVIAAVAVPALLSMVSAFWGVNPLDGMSVGLDLVSAYVPLGTMMGCLVVLVVFRVTVNSIGQVAGGVVKLLVGL